MAAITPITIGRAAFGARTTRPYNQPAYAAVPPTIEYLLIAGGGGGGQGPGGNYTGGGGGAGGVIQGSGYGVAGTRTYTVVVGGGGPRAPGGNQNGVNGSNTGFYATATGENTWGKGGGGGGGGFPESGPGGATPRAGAVGGSGGGGSQRDGSGGAGTGGQGNAGGSGCNGPSGGNGGGGGGAGAGGGKGLGPSDGGAWPAAQPTSPFATGVGGWGNGGLGGVGISTSFDGTPRALAGGGGGGGDLGVRSFGGRNGGLVAPFPANEPFGGGESRGDGGNQKGGGGGGAGSNPSGEGGSGGSGIFWIRYPAEYAPIPNYTGLSEYTDNGTYKIYKWNGSGSWSWNTPGVNPAP